MKKYIIIFLMIIVLSGCSRVTRTAVVVPENVNIIDQVLTWDSVTDATSYTVKINADEYTVITTSYDLSLLEVDHIYTIQVKANGSDSSSIYSTALYFDTTVPPLTYVSGENIVIELTLDGGVFGELNGNGISEYDYSISGNTLTINFSFFESLLIDNPSRTTVIISYSIVDNDLTTIGYIFIAY